MTRSEKKKVLEIVKAGNAMAAREKGAKEKWVQTVPFLASALLGRRLGKSKGKARGTVTLGAAEGAAVFGGQRDTLKEQAKKRAEVAIDVVELEGVRGRKRMENRAVALMDTSLSTLQRMRRELKAGQKIKQELGSKYNQEKAKIAVRIAMRGKRGDRWTEDRALRLMDHSLTELRRMRRESQAKEKAKRAA